MSYNQLAVQIFNGESVSFNPSIDIKKLGHTLCRCLKCVRDSDNDPTVNEIMRGVNTPTYSKLVDKHLTFIISLPRTEAIELGIMTFREYCITYNPNMVPSFGTFIDVWKKHHLGN